jgi:phosphoribosylformylglycinamidine cyclo-ligase
MRRTFNCGVGMVIAIEPAQTQGVVDALKAAGEAPFPVGELGLA